MQTVRHALCLILVLVSIVTGRPAPADDGCLDFKWDVTKERALFAGTPSAKAAGKDSKSAPAVAVNRLYKLQLLPQEQVTFAAAPGRKSAGAGAFAGIARLHVAAPGSYRFSLDLPVWLDVVSNGMLVAAQDFQGQHACAAPHKIVEFELSADQPLTLQFSNAPSEDLLLTITATPVRKL